MLIGTLSVFALSYNWIRRYLEVAVKLRKIQLKESAAMAGVFFNLLEGLPVIRCTQTSERGPN